MKRALTILTAGALLLLTLTACGGASQEADAFSALDTQRGLLLSLGMTKADLEDKLGEELSMGLIIGEMPESGDVSGGMYPGFEEGAPGASLMFQNDLLMSVHTKDPALKLQGDFGVGSLVSQLGDGWTLTRISDTVDSATRYFDQEGNLLPEATAEAVVMQTLTFFDGSDTAGDAGLYTLN